MHWVIGAGAAGLTAVKNVVESHSTNYEVRGFEQSEEVGGLWATGRCWDSLMTNLPANAVMAFRDFPYPNGPSYVHHTAVRQYLRDYADAFGLRKYFAFGTRVTSVRHGGDSEWIIQTTNGATHTVAAVVVASGHFSQPYVPPIRGLPLPFPPTIAHSGTYTNNTDYTGQHVLIIGCGASGVEIAPEIAAVAQTVTVVAPKRKPQDEFFEIPQHVRASHPNLALREDLVHRLCVVDGGEYVAELESGGRVHGISRILFCTGYLYDYPFLHRECGISVDEGKRVRPLVEHLWNAEYPTMCFPALLWKALTFPLIELQVRVFLRVLKETNGFLGEVGGEWGRDERLRRARFQNGGRDAKYGHMLGEEHEAYVRRLLSIEYKDDDIPDEWERMLAVYAEAGPARLVHGADYRKRDYILKGRDFHVVNKF
eukprot:CAMPEP_0119153714 /NCGR_PEP_ID=MMETSP1310-20130426/49662_1 /TAXON_ID=464262 /ORGANISM="Genus nov. species nov., Strain RCC2339" /LENGTH=425 /DNA_ID=CAMNT_0007146187 /DNA_START=218 /DNA_END=1496 /DNA_ORIENTATION=+